MGQLSADVRAVIRLTGEIAPGSFERFARVRAQRLGLELRIGFLTASAASLTVRGQRDLVDAFEMACTLGPSDCLIDEVSAQRRPVLMAVAA